jgi:hypothetical protein
MRANTALGIDLWCTSTEGLASGFVPTPVAQEALWDMGREESEE